MSFFLFLLGLIIFCFPVYYGPTVQVGLLMLISFGFVAGMSLFSSFWFSYILFLIYVGGLLVLFIYICLVSSNFPLKTDMMKLFSVMMISLIFFLNYGGSPLPMTFMGANSWSSGAALLNSGKISLFLGLVVLLLIMLLAIVRVSGAGTAIVSNDKA